MADMYTEGEQLYSGVKTIVAEYLDRLAEERIVPAFPRTSGTAGTSALGGGAEAVERAVEGDRFLRAVRSVWDDHVGAMVKIKAILGYLVSHCIATAGFAGNCFFLLVTDQARTRVTQL